MEESLKQYLPALKAVNSNINFQDVLNFMVDVDYAGWTDLEMIIYYIEHK